MKKYIVLILFFIIISTLFTGCANKKKLTALEKIKNRGYLIAGVKNDSPPFGYYDKNGALVGIDIEIAHRIANEIFKNDYPSNIQFVPVSTEGRIASLNSGEVDIIVATLSINDKRKLIIDFSRPYFAVNQKIMVPFASKITHLQYFNSNGVLAIIQGATGSKIIRQFAPNARIVTAPSYLSAFKILESGNADGIFGDDSILKGLNYDNKYKIVNHAYSRELYAVAVRKSEDTKELLQVINSVISTLLDEKDINLIKKQFISF